MYTATLASCCRFIGLSFTLTREQVIHKKQTNSEVKQIIRRCVNVRKSCIINARILHGDLHTLLVCDRVRRICGSVSSDIERKMKCNNHYWSHSKPSHWKCIVRFRLCQWWLTLNQVHYNCTQSGVERVRFRLWDVYASTLFLISKKLAEKWMENEKDCTDSQYWIITRQHMELSRALVSWYFVHSDDQRHIKCLLHFQPLAQSACESRLLFCCR